jgi:hypothetical protein
MKRTILAAIGLAVMAAGAYAHDGDDDWRRSDRRAPARYERWNPVERSIRDLQAIYSRARVDRHEADHFRRAIGELSEFQRRAARGDFDRKRLDRALDNMDHLADARQLHPRDRAVVRSHMRELENLRASAHRGRW